MRVIQVGVGGMGTAWTPALQANAEVEIVGFVDVDTDVLAKTAGQFGIPTERCFTEVDEALTRVDCDAVVLVTPPVWHAPQRSRPREPESMC